jgi:hypothetical protein
MQNIVQGCKYFFIRLAKTYYIVNIIKAHKAAFLLICRYAKPIFGLKIVVQACKYFFIRLAKTFSGL